jgi:hypothetical protein
VVQYKEYEIEALETSPRRYRAWVRRIDGRKIRTLVPEKEHDSIKTGGMECLRPEDAIELAKEMIDSGGMV